MNIRPREEEAPEINLTPLIDVVFLLLIFFMVTTSFIKNAELKIELPEASREPSAERTEGLEVAVDADGGYYVGGREVVNARPETLRTAIAKVAGDARSMPVTIRADGRASHQAVVNVLDVAGQLGFSDIVIETVNREEAPAP